MCGGQQSFNKFIWRIQQLEPLQWCCPLDEPERDITLANHSMQVYLFSSKLHLQVCDLTFEEDIVTKRVSSLQFSLWMEFFIGISWYLSASDCVQILIWFSFSSFFYYFHSQFISFWSWLGLAIWMQNAANSVLVQQATTPSTFSKHFHFSFKCTCWSSSFL